MKAGKSVLWALLLWTTGCVTLPWVPAEALYTSQTKDYSVALPKGWMRWNLDEDDDLLVTRDGTSLQSILIVRVHVDDKLRHTKKKLAKGMMPQEAAEVILDNYGSDPNIFAFEVKENSPASISGLRGFRAVYTYKTKDGLKMKGVFYGSMRGDVLYGIRYAAPQRHYFDRDMKTFERVLASFKLAKAA